MNKKISILITAVALSTLVYVGCKSDNDDDATPAATCTDGIMNGTETGIDCGGTCTACVTCSDGIQNGTETDIDCGGTCTPCAAPSFTATVSNFGAFVADTTPTLTYADSSRGGGLTLYKVNAKNGPSATSRFELSVRFNDLTDTVKVNKEYNFANNNGAVVTSLIFYQTVGASSSTYACNAGKIIFTKINHSTRRVSGTFDFTGSTGTVTKTITNGVFTNLPLN